jgi:hypothetical protein
MSTSKNCIAVECGPEESPRTQTGDLLMIQSALRGGIKFESWSEKKLI